MRPRSLLSSRHDTWHQVNRNYLQALGRDERQAEIESRDGASSGGMCLEGPGLPQADITEHFCWGRRRGSLKYQ